MPIYVRDLHPPSSPTLSELSSTVSTTAQLILKNLDRDSTVSDASTTHTWLQGLVERKVVDPTWEQHVRNEKSAARKRAAPKASFTVQPTPIEQPELEHTEQIDDLYHFSKHNTYTYLTGGRLYVNRNQFDTPDTIESIFEVIPTTIEIEQPVDVEADAASSDGAANAGEAAPCLELPLLVIVYQTNLGEVRIAFNFNGQFINYSDLESSEALELTPEEADPLTINPRSIIPEEGANGQVQPTTNFQIFETVYSEQSCMLAMSTRKEQNDENCLRVIRLPLSEWQLTIKEAHALAAEEDAPLMLENRQFAPTELQWERRESTDAKYENLSDKMATRYRKLHTYLNRAHERLTSQPEQEKIKNLNMFWSERLDLVLCWTFSSANKVQVFRMKEKAAKGGKVGGSGGGDGSQSLVARQMLVDDVKQLAFRDEVLAAVCGLERRNVFVYYQWRLWCSIKGSGPISDIRITADLQKLLVAYADNSIVEYDIKCSTGELSDLQKALQIITEPESRVIKPVYPEDSKTTKGHKIFSDEDCDASILVHDSAALPLAIAGDDTSYTLNSDVPPGIPVRKVVSSGSPGRFFLLFENGQLMQYEIPVSAKGCHSECGEA